MREITTKSELHLKLEEITGSTIKLRSDITVTLYRDDEPAVLSDLEDIEIDEAIALCRDLITDLQNEQDERREQS